MAWHHPDAITIAKFEDDLLRQNSLIHDNWRVYRWTDRQVAEDGERVKEQLALFLGSIPGLLAFDDFLPKQRGEVVRLELRRHQQEALEALERLRAEGKTIALLTHATGTGKTIVAIEDARRLEGRTLFLAHRKRLIRQAANKLREHRSVTTYVQLNPEFAACTNDATFRDQARRILVATYFEPAERNALYHLLGMAVPSDDEIAQDASFERPDDARLAGREARFRLDVVPTYNYTCALTGYRVTTIGKGTLVDAAHIHEFSDSRNNEPRNGLALCKNAHWLFDAGLWSIRDDYRIIVAKDAFSEDSPDQKPLTEYDGSNLRLPNDESLWPDPRHLAWHRKHTFLGAA